MPNFGALLTQSPIVWGGGFLNDEKLYKTRPLVYYRGRILS